MKPKLGKYDTALLMCTKNHKITLKYNYDEDEDFEFSGNSYILNDYLDIAYAYADSRAIPLSSVRIEYIVQALIEIYAVLQPEKLKDLLLNLVNKYYFINKSIPEIMFTELYGKLQALDMVKNDQDIYDLDYSLTSYKGK